MVDVDYILHRFALTVQWTRALLQENEKITQPSKCMPNMCLLISLPSPTDTLIPNVKSESRIYSFLGFFRLFVCLFVRVRWSPVVACILFHCRRCRLQGASSSISPRNLIIKIYENYTFPNVCEYLSLFVPLRYGWMVSVLTLNSFQDKFFFFCRTRNNCCDSFANGSAGTSNFVGLMKNIIISKNIHKIWDMNMRCAYD